LGLPALLPAVSTTSGGDILLRRLKNRQKRARYAARHPERIKAKDARYKATHRQKFDAYQAAYFLAHRKQKQDYRRSHKHSVKSANRRYSKSHPEVLRAIAAKRRAVKMQATIGDIKAIAKWEKRWRTKRPVTCYWCGKKNPGTECHADHVIPLRKGGAHSLANLVISCAACNRRKHDALLPAWNAKLKEPVLL
jgi:5-methylcytosine-specific restriction endonuclease McrA